MAAVKRVTVQTNRDGNPLAVEFILHGDGPGIDPHFSVTLVDDLGHHNIDFTAENGFVVVTKGHRVSVTENIEMGCAEFGVFSDKATISASGRIHLASNGDVHAAADGNVVLSAITSVLAFGTRVILNAVASISMAAATIAIEAVARLTLKARLVEIDGQVVIGKTPRPVARVGDKVAVATSTGLAYGEIVSGSSTLSSS